MFGHHTLNIQTFLVHHILVLPSKLQVNEKQIMLLSHTHLASVSRFMSKKTSSPKSSNIMSV